MLGLVFLLLVCTAVVAFAAMFYAIARLMNFGPWTARWLALAAILFCWFIVRGLPQWFHSAIAAVFQ